MNPKFMAPALHSRVLERLAQAYTSIEQPVGPFGVATLAASTNVYVWQILRRDQGLSRPRVVAILTGVVDAIITSRPPARRREP
jgi:hypothetical protein